MKKRMIGGILFDVNRGKSKRGKFFGKIIDYRLLFFISLLSEKKSIY